MTEPTDEQVAALCRQMEAAFAETMERLRQSMETFNRHMLAKILLEHGKPHGGVH